MHCRLWAKTAYVVFCTPNVPAVNPQKELTTHMQANLRDAEKALKRKLKDGEVEASSIVIFPVDRADGKVFQRVYSKNIAPTLTCSNRYLFVASMDLHRSAEKRSFWRLLLPAERFVLQGFPADLLHGCDEWVQVKASGNAYPMPLMASILAPMLQAFASKPLGLRTPLTSVSDDISVGRPACDRFVTAVQSFAGKVRQSSETSAPKAALQSNARRQTSDAKRRPEAWQQIQIPHR